MADPIPSSLAEALARLNDAVERGNRAMKALATAANEGMLDSNG